MKLDLVTIPLFQGRTPLLSFEASLISMSLDYGRIKTSVNFLTHHAFVEHADCPIKLYSVAEDGVTKTKVAELAKEALLSNGICARFSTDFLLDLDPGLSIDVVPKMTISPVTWHGSEISWRVTFVALIRISKTLTAPQTPQQNPLQFSPVVSEDKHEESFVAGTFNFIASPLDCLLVEDPTFQDNSKLNKWFRHVQILEFITSGQFF